MSMNRRQALFAGAASTLFFGAGGAGAQQDRLEEIKRKANAEGRVVLYYNSVPPNLISGVVELWKKKYPAIDLQYQDVAGGDTIGRVVRESAAGGPTCDVCFTTLATIISPLAEQNLLREIDLRPFGINADKAVQPSPVVFRTHYSLYGVAYNTKLVKPEELPKTVEEILNPRWVGKWGTWSRAAALMPLASYWGEGKAIEFVERLAKKSRPRLFKTGAAWADALTSGEMEMCAFVPMQPAIVAMRTGAPIDIAFPAPVGITPLYSYMPKAGANPNAAILLLHWLTERDTEARLSYVTGRGDPFDGASDLGKRLAGKEMALMDPKFEMANATRLADLEGRFGEILQGRG